MIMVLFRLTDVLIILVITLVILLYKYVTRKFDYWRKRNVAGPPPKPFVGNLWDLITFKYAWSSLLKNLYDAFDEPFIGFFTFDEPAFLVRDPKIIKDILEKDFNYFQDRVMHQAEHDKLMRNVLFAQKNPAWKTTRAKLTPVFSSAKIRDLFLGVDNVCNEMVTYINTNETEQESKSLCVKFATEVITQTFFGVRGQCFEREDSEFLKNAKSLFGFSITTGLVQMTYFFKGSLVRLFKLNFFDKNVEAFFKDAFWKCLKNVEGMKTKPYNFITIMEELRRKDSFFDDDLLESQGLMFFVAGTETVATTISFVLYELSLNTTIQEKVRTEINDVITKKGLNFESIKEMKYLEMCIFESMRKYPPLTFLDRKCTSNYQIPGTDVVIEKDIAVYIPIQAIQNDNKYFPDPEKYIPERFLENVNECDFVYAPFGSGQRSCIGGRFGMLCTKLALVHILKKFSVEKTPRTPEVVVIDPKCLPLTAKGGLPLKFQAL